MTLRLRELALELDEPEELLGRRLEEELGLGQGEASGLRVLRRGIDARGKPRILRIFTLAFEVQDEEALLSRNQGNPRLGRLRPEDPMPWSSEEREALLGAPKKEREALLGAPKEEGEALLGAPREIARPPGALSLGRPHRSVVVGMGPAGLFAALGLARSGSRVTLVERGRKVEERQRDVARFWGGGGLDPQSNMQFGEGGAGAFSDGKLTTRIHHGGVQRVLGTLVACGAPERILTDAKPHLGTDQLGVILVGMRRALESLGVELRYSTRLTGFVTEASAATSHGGGAIRAAVLDDREELPCDCLVLAPGHSARDTYSMLHERGVAMAPKAFAMGLRVEHPAALIHRIQYGRGPHPLLPAPEYALAWTDRETGRATYSFCMCPGGQVVNCASEPGGLVVNGMSSSRRDGARSNAALVVTVRQEDLGAIDPLAGVRFQRRYEEAAFRAGGGDYRAPAQNLLAFLGPGRGKSRKPSVVDATGPLETSCLPGVREADLAEVLPDFVTQALRRALPRFDGKLRGFVTGEAVLVGVETRTSAPLRLLRDESGQSVSHPGLYPAGEGSGYSGGIVSSAVDGLKIAERVASSP
ncbi:MAG: FAD-binding protein [Polyangia bacterium]|jgi:uncharacterized FAD-dependent dehydrogenase|nr:FAD-binding protein [Polyangia bacterium]